MPSAIFQRVDKVSTRWQTLTKGRQIFLSCIRRRTGVRQSAREEKARKHKAFSMIALCLLFAYTIYLTLVSRLYSLRSDSFFNSLKYSRWLVPSAIFFIWFHLQSFLCNMLNLFESDVQANRSLLCRLRALPRESFFPRRGLYRVRGGLLLSQSLLPRE